MAVTIQSSPDTHTPAYNEQYFVATSTNTAQTNFKYVCNVTVGGVTTQQKFNKRPDNSKVYFNPQRIVESSCLNTWDTSITQISRATNSIKAVTVGMDEEYGSTPAQYAGTSATYYVWNAAYTAVGYKAFTYSATTSSKSLTSLTGNKIYYTQANAFLYWHRGFSTVALYYMNVLAYTSSGSLIKTTQILNNYNGYSGATNGIIYANCSPSGLQAIKTNNPADIISETSPGINIVPSTAAYYDVSFTTIGLLDSSASFRITIDSFCSKYEAVALHFLNRLGGYDWFVFNKLKRIPSSKKTLDYKKFPFELNASNNYTYDLQKGDQFNYNTVITNKLILNSNWLTEAEATLLLDLMTSPDVKYEDASGNVYSIQITDKDYEPKKKVNDKLIQLQINAEFTYEDIRQRG